MQDVPNTEWQQWSPTWHFEVAATRGGPQAPFYLSNGQVDRVRMMLHPLYRGEVSLVLEADVACDV